MKTIPTQQELKSMFDYAEGYLIRKDNGLLKNNPKHLHVGSKAGGKTSAGYTVIKIKGRIYMGHRLIWLYHNGYWPENDIDHIDRDKSNNRIENLREVTEQCNARNSGNPINNTSGVRGVSWHKKHKVWRAKIKVNKIAYILGSSPDFIEAVAYRLAAEQCLKWSACDISSPAQEYIRGWVSKNIPLCFKRVLI